MGVARGAAAEGEVNAAFAILGLHPPCEVAPLVPVLRKIVAVLSERPEPVVAATVQLATTCAALPERAEAAQDALQRAGRSNLRARLPGGRPSRALDLADPAQRDLFTAWAPWASVARVGDRRHPVLQVAASGSSLWAVLADHEFDAVDRWLRSRGLGKAVDMDTWAAEKRATKRGRRN